MPGVIRDGHGGEFELVSELCGTRGQKTENTKTLNDSTRWNIPQYLSVRYNTCYTVYVHYVMYAIIIAA